MAEVIDGREYTLILPVRCDFCFMDAVYHVVDLNWPDPDNPDTLDVCELHKMTAFS